MPDGPNLNYVGSSGWGILPDGRYGRLTQPPKPPTGTQRQDYGVYDVGSRQMVSVLTGKPFSGVEPRTGVSYANGHPSAQSAASMPGVNPNDPTQVFKPFTLPKDPAMESTRQQLVQEFSKANADALTGVDEYLKNYQDQLNASLRLSQQATDPTATIAALRYAQANYDAGLNTANDEYLRAMDAQASRMRDVVSQAQSGLAGYDAAQDAVKGDQMAQYLRGWKLLKASGVNAPGGYDAAILAREAARAAIPVELAKQERKYDVLRSMALPTEQLLGANAISYASQFRPQMFMSRYGVDSGTAMNIQSIMERAATMGLTNGLEYIKAAALGPQIKQDLMRLMIANAGGLTQLGDMTQYRGVQDVLGANLREPQGFNMNMGPLFQYSGSRPSLPVTPASTSTGTGPYGLRPTGRPYQYDAGLGGVAYRPIPGAPGGPPLDVSSRVSPATSNYAHELNQLAAGNAGMLSPLFYGPALSAYALAGGNLVPQTLAHSTPNVGTGTGLVTNPLYGTVFAGRNADEYNARFGAVNPYE